MEHQQNIIIREFASADDLWEQCSPTKKLGLTEAYNLIYRGQADAEWNLTPSLWRNLEYITSCQSREDITAELMLVNELNILKNFVQYCDRVGVRIPNDSRDFRNEFVSGYYLQQYFDYPGLWPTEYHLDFVAMAQHHGVPTRLLDWTRLPYVALYFAASSALEVYKSWNDEKKIALWVLVKNHHLMFPFDNASVCECPGATSKNLAAQSGLFTVHYDSAKGKAIFEPNSLEKCIAQPGSYQLHKCVLPVYESVRLFELCKDSGFSGSDIYPTADGAGRAVRDLMNYRMASVCHKEKITS